MTDCTREGLRRFWDRLLMDLATGRPISKDREIEACALAGAWET